MAKWTKAGACKAPIRGFESHRHLSRPCPAGEASDEEQGADWRAAESLSELRTQVVDRGRGGVSEQVGNPLADFNLAGRTCFKGSIGPILLVDRPSSRRARHGTKRCIPRQLECSRGLTLVELVMVLFVISLMLALSFPLFTSLAGRFRVGSARDVFVNTYARTRAAAVQFGRESRLRIDVSSGRFWVEVDTGYPPALATDTIGTVVDVARDYGGVTMFTAKQKLCFDARGLTYSGADGCETHDAVITFSRLSRTDTVQLSLGGTVVRRF